MTLPRQNSAWVDGDGRPTRDLYNWARQITVQPQTGSAPAYALGDLTNVRLSGISDGDVLTWSNTQGKWVNSAASSSGYAEGTAFPSSPTTGDKFYRTDLNWLCFYDGTRWLTCHEYVDTFGTQATTQPVSGSPITVFWVAARRDYQPYLCRYVVHPLVQTTNNTTNYWSLAAVWGASNLAVTTLNTVTTQTGAAGVNLDRSFSVNAPLNTNAFFLEMRATKVGSPGTLFLWASVTYRLIIT